MKSSRSLSSLPTFSSTTAPECSFSWDSLKAAPAALESLPAFIKPSYTPHGAVSARSQDEVEAFKEKNRINTGSSQIRPVTNFEESGLPMDLVEVMKQAGFAGPTPIQSVGWPIALSGQDAVGIAQTGSGKTLSFVLPAIVHIRAQQPLKEGDGPIGVILAPTRELALQITDECVRFGKCASRAKDRGEAAKGRVYVACIYGGAGKMAQQRELDAGVHLVVATPGRLLDFLSFSGTDLSRATFLVLDEADRMLDMGFEPQIRRVLSYTRPDRQTLMWSATWPIEVQNLAKSFLKSPEHIRIGADCLTANSQIEQRIEFVTEFNKFDHFMQVMQSVGKTNGAKVVVFVQTKRGCEELFHRIRERKWPAEAIHGDKTQREREEIIGAFKNGNCKILLATDVASRGLDVKDVSHVINFDLPPQIEDYIHRIGRTARAGATGVSISFFTPRDSRLAKDLVKVLSDARQKVPEELRGAVSGRRGDRSRSPRRGRY